MGTLDTATTHIGTEAAVLLDFGRDLAAIAASWWRPLTAAGNEYVLPEHTVELVPYPGAGFG